MAIGQSNAVFTPEDLLKMPDGDRYELVDGQLVEKDMGWKSSLIASELYRRIANFAHENSLGLAIVEGSYQCFPDAPMKVRKPDVSFLQRARVPLRGLPDGHCPVAPDLAVEVVSPNDLYSEIESKVDEYIAAGVALVWIIDPSSRKVHVYRPHASAAQRLGDNDELTGDDILPGFHCRVADIFAPADPPGEKPVN